MITDAFSEEAIVDHDVEDYKNKLQDDWWSSKTDLTICRIWIMLYILRISIKR